MFNTSKRLPSGCEFSSFLAPRRGPRSSVKVRRMEKRGQVSVQACPSTQMVWISSCICQGSLQLITSPFSWVHHHLDRFQPRVQGATGSGVAPHPWRWQQYLRLYSCVLWLISVFYAATENTVSLAFHPEFIRKVLDTAPSFLGVKICYLKEP